MASILESVDEFFLGEVVTRRKGGFEPGPLLNLRILKICHQQRSCLEDLGGFFGVGKNFLALTKKRSQTPQNPWMPRRIWMPPTHWPKPQIGPHGNAFQMWNQAAIGQSISGEKKYALNNLFDMYINIYTCIRIRHVHVHTCLQFCSLVACRPPPACTLSITTRGGMGWKLVPIARQHSDTHTVSYIHIVLHTIGICCI